MAKSKNLRIISTASQRFTAKILRLRALPFAQDDSCGGALHYETIIYSLFHEKKTAPESGAVFCCHYAPMLT